MQRMDKELFTTLGEALKQIGALSAIVLPLALGYSIWRTSSFHLIRRRLWLVLYGKDEIADKVTREAITDQSSLIAFRWVFGLPARTLKQAQRLTEWSDEHDENLYTVSTAGPYFDIEKLEIVDKLPNIRRRAKWLTVAFGLFLVLLALPAPGLMTRAYYQIKATKLWFSASASDVQEAGPPFLSTSFPFVASPSGTQPLTVEMCKENKIPPDAFGRSQSKVLCEFLTQPNSEKKVADAIHGQLFLLAYFFVCIGIVLAMFTLDHLRLLAAWKLKARLEEKTKQLALKFD